VLQIGGSIAGLMSGIMLKHHGYNVTILEKVTSPFREGYDAGIKIGPEVQEFLDKHDRVKREMVVVCSPGTLIDVSGKPRAQRGQTITNTSWGLLINVLRANFDGLTSNAVPIVPEPQETDGKGTFRLGACATGIDMDDGKVNVHIDNAKSGTTETLTAGVVIVADGSNSAMRAILLPNVQREYAGYMCWRGTVREEEVDEKWNDIYSDKATFQLMHQTYLLK
jgi:2-polyprenyl-6-methoxyphenol hydroxylase-like FAD-dependent oxidoreductase